MITTQDKQTMNRICMTYNFNLQMWQKDCEQRLFAIDAWLEAHVPKNEYTFEFEDYGQHGEYILYIKNEEDFLALKLAVTPV
jgi:hypothetical protein